MKKDEIKQAIFNLAREYYREAFGAPRDFKYIPASGKVLDDAELVNMIDASLDMWLTTGRFNDEFEKKFAETVGARFALSVNSGSSANLLAVTALTSHKLKERRLLPGDEVVTVAAGFPTTVNPIIQNGLVPVFVDSEIGTYNMDADQLEAALSPKTKAVFVAHTLGNPFDLAKVQDVCRRHNLWLIEDSCDALGAQYGDKKTGSIGDIGTFSFYPAHHITMGEGGAVVTSNATLQRVLLSLRDWGRDCWCAPGRDNTCNNRFNFQLGNLPKGYDHKYTYSHVGYNLKITDWQASLGLAQLEKLPGFVEKRRQNAAFLRAALADLQDVLILPEAAPGASPSWFGFLISVRPEAPFTKQALVEHLEKNGVGTRQLFAGNILRQPMFTQNDIPLRIGAGPLVRSGELGEAHYAQLPNADFIMNRTFWVGCFPALGEAELTRTADTIRAFARGR